MKLRFRANSLRIRVNQEEVRMLAAGESLQDRLEFPGNATLAYILKTDSISDPQAIFAHNRIQVTAPRPLLRHWAESEDIGLYFTLPTSAAPLKIAIEKDLECVDGPADERDPNAYPRKLSEKAC